MVSAKYLACLLLLVIALAPAASAGGIVKFHVSPVADPKVGDTVTATIYNDNNLAPKAGEVVLMLDWNPEVMRYVSSSVAQGHTKASDPIGMHNLEIRTADTANGLPNGDEPLATVTFKIVGPGFTPIVVDVRSVHDTTGADITSKAVSQNGAVTATGTPAPTGSATLTPTVTFTTAVTTVAPTGSVPVPTISAITTVPTAVTTAITTGITTGITTAPTAFPVTASSDGSSSHDTGDYTGVVTRTATPTVTATKNATPNATATPNVTATPTPTANVTTASPTVTATPTPIVTANATTVRPATSNATPTATKAALPFGLLALAALGLVAARRH
jgi:hypothetical protein